MSVNEAEELSRQQRLWKGGTVFLHAIRPLLLYLLLPALLMCAGMLLPGERDAKDMVSRSGNFYYTLGILLTLYLLYRRCKKRGVSILEEVTLEYKGLDWKKAARLLGMGLGFAWFFSAVLTVVPLPQILLADYSQTADGLKSGTDQLLAILSTVFLAPLAEELIFRGFMLNRLLGWFNQRHSILITTVIFGLCHVSLIWMLYALFMGLLLAWVAVREDNIAYSMVLHVGFNLNVLPVWIINNTPGLSKILFASHWLVAGYGAAAVLAAVWLYKRYKREDPIC